MPLDRILPTNVERLSVQIERGILKGGLEYTRYPIIKQNIPKQKGKLEMMSACQI